MEISQTLHHNEHADLRLELQSMDHILHLFVLLFEILSLFHKHIQVLLSTDATGGCGLCILLILIGVKVCDLPFLLLQAHLVNIITKIQVYVSPV